MFPVTPTLWIKILLAVVCLIFVWFFVGATFGSPPESDQTKQLLGIAAVGFGLAAIILP